MIVAWRLCQRQVTRKAFDGEGAFLHGGRWNLPGIRVVYVASSLALAALEILVHIEDGYDLLSVRYVAIGVRFDRSLVTTPRKLPRRWREDPPSATSASVGDALVKAGSSAVLRVPSAVVPSESNYLLNPAHRDFTRVRIAKPTQFAFPPRLAQRRV